MTIEIKLLDNRITECDNVVIGKTYENEATTLKFYLTEEMLDKDFYLDFEKADGTKVVSPKLEKVEEIVEYSIPNSLLDIKGELKCEAVLRKDNEVWKSYTLKFNILNSINASEEMPEQYPDFVSGAQAVIDLIETKGDGSKFLADDGTYKETNSSYTENDPTVPEYVKNITQEDIEKWNEGGGITTLVGTTESPIILRDLEEGVYLLEGKTVPYVGGAATTFSNSFCEIQKGTGYTYAQILFAQNNNLQFYKVSNNENTFEKTTTSFSKLEEKSKITKNTSSTTLTVQLADKLFYQAEKDLTTLTLRFPSTLEEDYKSRIAFKTGTSITLTCDYEVKWYGEDVSNSVFTPQPSKFYYLEFYQNIDGINAYVRPNYIGEELSKIKSTIGDINTILATLTTVSEVTE